MVVVGECTPESFPEHPSQRGGFARRETNFAGIDHCTSVCVLPRIYDIHWHEEWDDAWYSLSA